MNNLNINSINSIVLNEVSHSGYSIPVMDVYELQFDEEVSDISYVIDALDSVAA